MLGKKVRLIDATQLEEVFENLVKSTRGTWSGLANTNALERVKNAPTVDAVEVVRCKDCKHWDANHCSDGQGWCPKVVGYRYDCWYCAAGESR